MKKWRFSSFVICFFSIYLFFGLFSLMTPNGQTFTEISLPPASSGPLGITAGPDGNLSFTELDANANKTGNITFAGVITEFNVPTAVSGTPVPDILANNSKGPITVSSKNPLLITVSLDAGDHSGENADWWAVAMTPFGWYYYDVSSDIWKPNFVVTHKGPLLDLPPFEVLNQSGLPIGFYTFYFGVDMNMNGNLDLDKAFYDSVDVNVTQ